MNKNIKLIALIALTASLTGCGGSYSSSQPQSTVEPTVAEQEMIKVTLKGEGTKENPYLIETLEDLMQLSTLSNHDEMYRDYNEKYYRLTADISLNDTADFENWEEKAPAYEWQPIGKLHDFRGIFDGDGHTISGLFVNNKEILHPYNSSGLFGEMASAEIRNLKIENALIFVNNEDNETQAGLLAGTSVDTFIENCSAKGTVIGTKGNYGGLVGAALASDITGCSFSGKMIDKGRNSSTKMGGITGYASGDSDDICVIRECISSAEMTAEVDADGTFGGISGTLSPGASVEKCSFEGIIQSGDYAGGIAGHVSATDAEPVSQTAKISECENNGYVYGKGYTGGIAAFAYNTSGAHELVIENCTNNGTLSSAGDYVGGILGGADTRTQPLIQIVGCVNKMDIEGGSPAGILSSINQMAGCIRIEKCVNEGKISSNGLYAAGILCYVANLDDDWEIDVEGCINQGEITSSSNAGGIVCFTNGMESKASNTKMILKDCKNTGNLISESTNAYLGGILGVDGFTGTKVEITGCENYGNLNFTAPLIIDRDTWEGDTVFTLTTMAGGIVGRIGRSILLSTDADKETGSNVNVDGALVIISDCHSQSTFLHPDVVMVEDLDQELIQQWEEKGKNVTDLYRTMDGGILGTIDDVEGYSVMVTNCTYTSPDRGMGNDKLPDVGSKK